MRIRLPGRRHLRTFTSLSSAGFGEAVLPTLSLIALVRVTGSETSGHVIFAQSVAVLWFLMFDPCLENAAQRFVPLEQRRTGHGAALFLRLLRLDAVIGLAATLLALLMVLGAWLLGHVSDGLALTFTLAIAGRGAMAPYATAWAGFALADRLQTSGVLRVLGAVLSFGLSLAGLFIGGPLLYLAGQAAGALVMAAMFCLVASRAVTRRLGPAAGRPRLPKGLLRFTLPTSMGTFVAGVSDSGILTIAGLVGGPQLVTILKIAMAPGRFYANVTVPIAAMLYPRLTEAVAVGAGSAVITRDVIRTTALCAGGGAVTAVVALPLIGTVITIAYGPDYGSTGAVAMLLLGAACVKGGACWSNVLPLAMGKPGLRLAYLCAEAALLVGTLLVAGWTTSATVATALVFAWGTLGLAIVGTGFWIASLGRVIGPRSPGSREEPITSDRTITAGQ
ncbi:hypothetical protein IL992_29555 [Microbispora sp. NEAU-D428]|uniref:lipopolysaccharide biosynthesis protein n=1 Tax=Microbispora sitophila TaxID=2771537 RepID=UPI001867CB05|nr:hypothetical protein [Microbispora sitophila]MBE3013298.1 hypothetical protein [Microbispora sitophila]